MLLSFQVNWGRALSWGLLAGVAEVLLVYGILWASGAVDVKWGLHTVDKGVWGVALGWLIGWRKGQRLYERFYNEELSKLARELKSPADEALEEIVEKEIQEALRERFRR